MDATRKTIHTRCQQTTGSACTAVPRIHSLRGMRCLRFAALLVGLVLLLTAAPVHASDDEGYLALGASFPFGFDPRVTDRSDPEVFVG